MPWMRAKLRGSEVYARVDAAGALAAEAGAVEIRYRLGDERAYRAQARNLELVAGAALGDDAFPEAKFAERSQDGAAGKTASKAAGAAGKAASKKAAAANVAAAPIPEGAVVAYTDGACSGNPGPAGLGVMLVEPGGAVREGYEYLGTATNNVGELMAILRALEAVPNDQLVVVHTDSQYAIGVLSKGWKAKANQELIASIKAALARRKPAARLVYVPGHAGVPGNERADELARTAITSRSTRLFGG